MIASPPRHQSTRPDHDEDPMTDINTRNWRNEPAEVCYNCGKRNTAPLDAETRKCHGCGAEYGLTPAMAARPSNLVTVVTAAARMGDPSNPDTLHAAVQAVASEAAAAADARVAEASRALHSAHMAVADAAGEWYDSVGDYSDSEALRRAVEAWRAAGEAFVQALRS